ncbi:Asp/Glu racemase [Roseovarius sp. MBR-6]|uniref:maleate cis-trans isomerase family protein n=1 Tax=Roseovarius sp. MBR-6 TaxID=3156459 RepID=UPI0033946EBE
MTFALDDGPGEGLQLGLIVLSTDTGLEWEARTVFAGRPAHVLHTRIPARDHVTPEDLGQMAPELTRTAALLPQGLRAVGYGCTSGATVIGPTEVAARVSKAHPGTPVTDPLSAVIAALGALGVRRIGMVSPYVAQVTAPMEAALAAAGIEVVAAKSFGESEDRIVGRIPEAATLAAIGEVGRETGVEAVFASCTNLRSMGVIDEGEAMLGRPVISSNQALFWHMLRLAGMGERAAGWGPGRLFSMT